MKHYLHKKIKTTFPRNIDAQNLSIYEHREYYSYPNLITKEKKNIFLTHYGIALKNLLPIRYTLPNAFGFITKPNAGFFFEFYSKGLEIHLVCKFGKSLSAINLNKNKKYLFAHSPWLGYFSWITESLPRILSVIERHQELTLILPEGYLRRSFIKESLHLYPNLKYEIIPEDQHMYVPQIVIPELKPYTYYFDPKTMDDFRSYVWNHVDSLSLQIKTYDKIYVSRKHAKNRKLVNNAEVIQVFNDFGYKEVAFEDYNFFEQVYLMKNCKVLSGVHGAGFANISFLPQKATLFEMIKEYSSRHEERPSYWRLSSALNINYFVQFCAPKKYGNYDPWVGVDLIVDLETLKVNLEMINI